jgi:hypothetical protein
MSAASADAPENPEVLTPEERTRHESARRAAGSGQWDLAFGEYQRLLQSVRARRAPALDRRLMAEFADLLERSGDRPRAERARAYPREGFVDRPYVTPP